MDWRAWWFAGNWYIQYWLSWFQKKYDRESASCFDQNLISGYDWCIDLLDGSRIRVQGRFKVAIQAVNFIFLFLKKKNNFFNYRKISSKRSYYSSSSVISLSVTFCVYFELQVVREDKLLLIIVLLLVALVNKSFCQRKVSLWTRLTSESTQVHCYIEKIEISKNNIIQWWCTDSWEGGVD